VCLARRRKNKDKKKARIVKPNRVTSDKSQNSGIELGGGEIHTNLKGGWTLEEVKKMAQEMASKGPPKDKKMHVIDHKKEDDGILNIDGKEVKKDNKEDLK